MSVYTGIKKLAKSNKGFTLIEVLIGVFIAAVGIVGVLEIQKHVIRSGNEVNARTIALQLVREKLDIINNVDAFSDVGTNPAPTDETINKSNYNFKRTWQMTAHHYDDDTNAWGTVGVDESTDAKHVIVSVSWTDINNEIQTVNGDQIISSASIHDTSTLSSSSGDLSKPNIPFNEISSIENPPITLVDDVDLYPTYNTKETSKPVPTVDARNGYNLIQFETVTYDTSSNKQTLEDFVTVNCSCSFNGTGEAKAPTILTISDDEESLTNDKDSGELITKVKGTTSGSGQPELCTACCEDHHDTSSSDAKYVVGSSTNHPHYDDSLGLVTSGDYVEACRFRRIDGFYEMVPDWQLADIIIMPKSYFYDSDNVSAYTSYVKAVVQAKLMGSAMPSKPSIDTRSLTDLVAGEYQLIARGIYVDLASLSSADLTTVKSYVSGTGYKPNWLEYVPFYEINLSLFGDWSSSVPSIASITNENISTIVDPDTDYYGTYSRGWLTALTTGSTVVTGAARTDNTGITGSGAIIPQTTSTFMADTINIAIDTAGGSVDTGTRSIKVSVNCIKYRNNGTLTTCTGQDGQSIDLNYSAGLTCSDGATASFPVYSSPNVTCNGISDTWSSGWVSLSYAGFRFRLSSADEGTEVNELILYIDMDSVSSDPKQFIEDVVMVKQ